MDNTLILDKAQYSFDGKNYSKKLALQGIFDYFLHERINKKVFLKFSFNIQQRASKLVYLHYSP